MQRVSWKTAFSATALTAGFWIAACGALAESPPPASSGAPPAGGGATTDARQPAGERPLQTSRIPDGLRKRLGPLWEKLSIPSNATIEEHDDSYQVTARPWHAMTTQVGGEAHSQAHHDHSHHETDDPHSTDSHGDDNDHSHKIIHSQYLADQGKLSVPKDEKGSIVFEMIGDAEFHSDPVSYSADRIEYHLSGADARMLLVGHAKFANDDEGVRLSADRIINRETSTLAEGRVRLMRLRPDDRPEVLTTERLEIDHESNTMKAGTSAAAADTGAATKAEQQADTSGSKRECP